MADHYIQVYDLSKYTLKAFAQVGEICIDSNNGYSLTYDSNGTNRVLATTLTGSKIAGGIGVLVTGAVVINTGLAGVLAFSADGIGTPAGTGVNSAQYLSASFTGTTGTVTVTAYYVNQVGASGSLAAASGSTGSISWIAVGL